MKKLICLLIIILSVCLVFSSCAKDGGDSTSDPAQSGESTEAPAADVTFIADGATEYILLRPENVSDTFTEAYVRLRKAINEAYGIQIKLGDDFEKAGTDPATRYAYEIAVGHTNREESSAALEGLGYGDSVVAVVGSRLVINGGNDEAIARAVDLFIEKYLKGDKLVLPGNLRDTLTAEYEKAGVTLGGVPLADYVIVYGSGYSEYARGVADRLGKVTGALLEVRSEKSEVAEHEIAIGAGSRTGEKVKFDTMDDFLIAEGGAGAHILISAGNKTALGMACARLCDRIEEGEKTDYAVSDLTVNYKLPASRDYVNDIESLPLHWNFDFQTPEWMLDYDEKYAASMDPSGRLMSCAHRGDMVYYPENSIEGIISAIMMGCDMVEIDPRLTKDGVLVLLHDATLTRTTNVEELAGKNGLPSSHEVSMWTYEQLMQLNLKTGTGGSGSTLTPYKIPTLEEAIKVCANRIFIRLDVKGPSGSNLPFWDFERDIWPLMQKYESYSNIIYTWHSWFKADGYKLPETYRAKAEELCGKPGIVFVSDQNTLSSTKKLISSHGFNPGVRIGANFADVDYKLYLSKYEDKLSSYKGKLRTYTDVHNGNNESHAFYAELFDAGINYMLVNKALSLCTYIANNFEPTQYK